MEVFPSEYQNLELTRAEKLYVRYSSLGDKYGFIFLRTNPAMLDKEAVNISITSKGVLFLKFFDTFDKPEIFPAFAKAYMGGLFQKSIDIISAKLLSNKALVDEEGKLLFLVNYVCVFPNSTKQECLPSTEASKELAEFVANHCIFKKDFSQMKTDYLGVINAFIVSSFLPIPSNPINISEDNISSIIQRIAPEYTTVRIGKIENKETKAGVDNRLLVVDEHDIAVKAFMLDADQINIVNKISKGDQLILACAGSGKSVLLIAKCFKAARMNPDKKFLITCYNRNLQSLYTWFIDCAGLKERNVECLTFHKLCKRLLEKHNLHIPELYTSWSNAVMLHLNNIIDDRYYGIFIDEVQMFEEIWYKLCFNLLENKGTEDHLFVICGDKTQKVKNQQKHGRAPWNAGEGYPSYRGGNKSIRIEKNYRNCIQINAYINRFVANAKKYINRMQRDVDIDPDMFLRGKAVTEGIGVKVKKLTIQSNQAEANEVIDSIKEIHNIYKISYDEIAIVIFNKKYIKRIAGWRDRVYNLETPLWAKLYSEGIPFSSWYSSSCENYSRYGNDSGVSLISTESVLGLDFRAVVLCGLKPLGVYDRTKTPNISSLSVDDEDSIVFIKENISNLYVAFTRAKEILHIIQPERGVSSVYMKMIEESI